MIQKKREKTEGEATKQRCKSAAVGAAAERGRTSGARTANARLARGADVGATASARTSPSTPASPWAVRTGHATIAPPRGAEQCWLAKSLTT